MECRKLLTDSNIEKIALAVAAACEADYDSSTIKRIKAAIQEADAAIENLWKALERGQAVDMITERIEKRKREKDDLQGQLAIEMGKQVTFTAPQIKAFLYSLKRGDVNDENNRRGMVNIFLRAIYLYDDRMTLILNGGDRPITIDDILLDEIEEHFESAVSGFAGCSPLVADAPPLEKPCAATGTRLFLSSFSVVFPYVFPLQIGNVSNVLFHPVSAGLFHLLCDVPIHVQREGGSVVSQVALYSLDIIPGPEGSNCKAVPI